KLRTLYLTSILNHMPEPFGVRGVMQKAGEGAGEGYCILTTQLANDSSTGLGSGGKLRSLLERIGLKSPVRKMTRRTDEHHLKVLRLLDANPDMSQRELAEALGVSVGKTNYCIRALVD